MNSEFREIYQEIVSIERSVNTISDSVVKMKSISALVDESGLTYSAIRGLCLERKIAFIRIGRKYMINVESFNEYLRKGDG